ncbi:MAG: hypothetical protein KIT22_14280 [Verrucomicrobiae bacterium]|nr:hypothetical protein [Verrucomicrobiae bacterium]
MQKGLCVLSWMALCIAALYLIFGQGWKDITLGRLHRKAHEIFSDVDGITEARIYLLMGTKGRETMETFPIRPYGRNHSIFGNVTLTGDRLSVFLNLWRSQSPAQLRRALCHDPVYGFRLYRGGRLVSETSICWHCNNYYVTAWPLRSSWYGFEADSETAQALLSFCDDLLPYARSQNNRK